MENLLATSAELLESKPEAVPGETKCEGEETSLRQCLVYYVGLSVAGAVDRLANSLEVDHWGTVGAQDLQVQSSKVAVDFTAAEC